tara:strand:- start:179 stop:433 length:255 start_codon:yes stop_codon:yes gene_type:complete
MLARSVRIKNNLLHLTVADNSLNSDSILSTPAQLLEKNQQDGMGLKNVVERLIVLYSHNYQFSIKQGISHGCVVSIALSMETST